MIVKKPLLDLGEMYRRDDPNKQWDLSENRRLSFINEKESFHFDYRVIELFCEWIIQKNSKWMISQSFDGLLDYLKNIALSEPMKRDKSLRPYYFRPTSRFAKIGYDGRFPKAFYLNALFVTLTDHKTGCQVPCLRIVFPFNYPNEIVVFLSLTSDYAFSEYYDFQYHNLDRAKININSSGLFGAIDHVMTYLVYLDLYNKHSVCFEEMATKKEDFLKYSLKKKENLITLGEMYMV